MTAYSVVTVTLEDRNDGGLRVFSEDLPGLILSGANKQKVCDRIAPAIRALLEHKGVRVANVLASQPLPEVIRQPSPRDVDMHVRHEQAHIQRETFVVVLANQGKSAVHHAHA
jgi:hypothetical protein